MSHYEERLEQDLEQIQDELAALAERVQTAVKNAVIAIINQDTELSYETILLDHPINRATEDVSTLCYGFIARHYPSAGHLRRIFSILHVCVDLERIGDKAETISRKAVQFSRNLNKRMKRNVESLAEEARHMLHNAITAFQEDNVELANSTAALAVQANRIFDEVFDDLTDEENKEKWQIKDLLGLLSVFDCLERITDHAQNICEETVYVVEGQAKTWRPVQILFLEESNDFLSLMAEAIGKKSFPNSARFSSAGLQAKGKLEASYIEFMEERGFDFATRKPKTLDTLPRLDDYTIAICLEGSITDYIEEVPYHLVVLEWDLGPILIDLKDGLPSARYEAIFHELSHRLHDLIEIVRGTDAD